MNRTSRRAALALLAALGLAASGLAVSGVNTAADAREGRTSGGAKVIASGLDNPRGLAFAPDGSLYVAESGAGGSGPCFVGPEGPSCFGKSGAVTRIGKWGHRWTQRRVLTRLPSFGQEGTGNAAIGPSDVAFKGHAMYVTVGLGLDLEFSNTIPALADMGELIVATKTRHHRRLKVRTVADLAEFEDEFNPTGDEENVNPNSALVSRRGVVVSDAGANDLLLVRKHGRIKVLATFPNRDVDGFSMDEVPTSVARGLDGALYVGQLTGFPFPVSGANVYRVGRNGAVTVHATGFTNIIDIAFDKRGRLYVLEIFTNGLLSGDPTGALIQVRHNGSQRLVTDDLQTPGGLALHRGYAYVSNCGTCADGGEVLRIRLD